MAIARSWPIARVGARFLSVSSRLSAPFSAPEKKVSSSCGPLTDFRELPVYERVEMLKNFDPSSEQAPISVAKIAGLSEQCYDWYNPKNFSPYKSVTEPETFQHFSVEKIKTYKTNCMGFVLQTLILAGVISHRYASYMNNLYFWAGGYSDTAERYDPDLKNYPEPGQFVLLNSPKMMEHIMISLGDGYVSSLWCLPTHNQVYVGHIDEFVKIEDFRAVRSYELIMSWPEHGRGYPTKPFSSIYHDIYCEVAPSTTEKPDPLQDFKDYIQALHNFPIPISDIAITTDQSLFVACGSAIFSLSLESQLQHPAPTEFYQAGYPIIHLSMISESLLFVGTMKSYRILDIRRRHIVASSSFAKSDFAITHWSINKDATRIAFHTTDHKLVMAPTFSKMMYTPPLPFDAKLIGAPYYEADVCCSTIKTRDGKHYEVRFRPG